MLNLLFFTSVPFEFDLNLKPIPNPILILIIISYSYIDGIITFDLWQIRKNLKILGIDPGTNILGYAVLDCTGAKPKVQDIGVLKLTKFKDHQTKLKEIFLQLQDIIETYLPNQMAIEAPFFGKNVQSMLKLGRAQGVAMAAAMTMGIEITNMLQKRLNNQLRVVETLLKNK